MKTHQFTFTSLALGAVGLAAIVAITGCGKQDAPATGSASPAAPAAPAAGGSTEKAVATAAAQTEVVKQKAQDVVTNVQAQTTATINSEAQSLTDKIQPLVDQAKKLVSEGNWTEALALLNKLSGENLSPEQQSLVQSLKEKAQTAIQAAAAKKASDQATKAVGGLLK